MKVKVSCPRALGEFFAIPSKSDAHRLLICAALSDAPCEIFCPTVSDDIEATAECLSALGAEIEYRDGTFFVSPIKKKEKATLDCRESGSTLRFLLPLASALGGEYELCGRGRLPSRPMGELIDALTSRGAEISGKGSLPLICRGGLSGGDFEIRGDISSQFISGLLFALPLLEKDSTVHIAGKCESLPYIEMTASSLSKFGIKVELNASNIYIKGGQRYRSPRKVKVEGDWSNAAFFLTLGAICPHSSVTCHGLSANSLQGDRAIVDILSRAGANVSVVGDSVTVSSGKLKKIEVDAADIPDLVPILATMAAASSGESVIYNIERLRLKESDRIKSTSEMLRNLGADVTAEEDKLIVRGKGRLRGGEISSENDHRIAMSAAIAASICDETVVITGAEAVRKSYVDFYKIYRALGADITEG